MSSVWSTISVIGTGGRILCWSFAASGKTAASLQNVAKSHATSKESVRLQPTLALFRLGQIPHIQLELLLPGPDTRNRNSRKHIMPHAVWVRRLQ